MTINYLYKLVSNVILLACVLSLTCCTGNSTRFVISADRRMMLAIGNELPTRNISLEGAVNLISGRQSTFLCYIPSQRQLNCFCSENTSIYRLIGNHVFDDKIAPTNIMAASQFGKNLILVQLHFDPTNSWYVLFNTQAESVRSYFASDFACNESGTQVAYISGQSHFGSDSASVFLNSRVVANLSERNYWHIRWDEKLRGFLLFNDKNEEIQVSNL